MKSVFASKTVWFNVLTVLIAVIGTIIDSNFLSPNILKILGLVSAVGNVILRFLTTQPISFNPDK
jgi:hypothetical protein